MKAAPILGFMFSVVPQFVLAGPNAGGVLALHDANLGYTADTSSYCGLGLVPDSCTAMDTEVESSGPENQRVWKVYAAFPDTSSPRLKAMTFGVRYPPDSLRITAYGPCIGDLNNGAMEIAEPGWPATGTGTSVVFQETQTSGLVCAYWFAGYNYTEAPTTFRLRTHPDPVFAGTFADDEIPAAQDPIAAFGSLGFGTPGNAPCPGDLGADGNGGQREEQDGDDGLDDEDPNRRLTFVETATSAASFLDTYRALKQELGLNVLLAMGPDGLICRTDEGQRERLLTDSRVSLMTTEPIQSPRGAHAGDAGFAENVWNAFLTTPLAADTLSGAVQESPDTLQLPTVGPWSRYHHTSDYLMGEVGVSLLVMESADSSACTTQHRTENWTVAEIDTVHTAVPAGLAELADLAGYFGYAAGVTFVVADSVQTYPMSVEPISDGDTRTMIKEAMDVLGVPTNVVPESERVYLFNNIRRQQLHTDWWATIFVIRNVCDADHRLPGGGLSMGGPGLVELLYWNYIGPERQEYGNWLHGIAAHEVSHCFDAKDEYFYDVDCMGMYGYLGVHNWNGCIAHEGNECTETCHGRDQVACLLRDPLEFRAMCDSTRAMLGWRDSDDDGILDPIDNPRAGNSMLIGERNPLEPGDLVDIFKDGTSWENWVKRLAVTEQNSDHGRILWDGIDHAGVPADTGTYIWTKAGVPGADTTRLSPDTDPPTITQFEIRNGTSLTDTLELRFTDPDTRSGRARLMFSPEEVGGQQHTILLDKFLMDANASGTVSVPFTVPQPGWWYVTARVWDVGRGGYHFLGQSHCVACDESSALGMDRHGRPALALSPPMPNPSRASVSWAMQQTRPGLLQLAIFGIDGRRVRSWIAHSLPDGSARLVWDCRDQRGRPVGSGRYFLAASDAHGNTQTSSVTIVR